MIGKILAHSYLLNTIVYVTKVSSIHSVHMNQNSWLQCIYISGHKLIDLQTMSVKEGQ